MNTLREDYQGLFFYFVYFYPTLYPTNLQRVQVALASLDHDMSRIATADTETIGFYIKYKK
jgi:hypothetical protein